MDETYKLSSKVKSKPIQDQYTSTIAGADPGLQKCILTPFINDFEECLVKGGV